MQTKACFVKEYLAFFRTKKFLILACVFLGWSVFSPLMIRGLGILMDFLTPIYQEFGVDVAGMTEMLGSSSSLGVLSAVSDLTGACLIVFLLLINNNAGGEQRKRSIIIPLSSGLRSVGYIFPKFVIYPLSAFVLAVFGALASYGISALVFAHNDVTLGGVFLAGVLAGVCLMFYVCAHVTVGTATGRAGLSAAICIVASLLIPNIFAFASLEEMYNPFTLNLLAAKAIQLELFSSSGPADVFISVLIALLLMALFYFLAIFAQKAKKIDNSGNEKRI